MSLLQAIEKQLHDAEMAYREARSMVEAGTLSSSRYYRNVRDFWWARYRKMMSDAPVAPTPNPPYRVIGGITYQLRPDGISYVPARAIITATVTSRV